MPLAPSAFRLQDAFGSFTFRLQDALSSFCRMPLAPFFFRTPWSPFLEGNSEICTHGHLLFFWQSAGFLFGPAVSNHGLGWNFCDSAFFGWDSNASCDEKKEWILICTCHEVAWVRKTCEALAIKLLPSCCAFHHFDRLSCLSIKFVYEAFVHYMFCLAVPGDSEKKSPYVMTDDFHLVKSWGSCIGKSLD